MKSHLVLFVLLLLSSTVFGMEKEFETGKVNTIRKDDTTRVVSNSRTTAVEQSQINDNKKKLSYEDGLPWRCIAMILFIALLICIISIFKLGQTNVEKIRVQVENPEKKFQEKMDNSLELQRQYLRTIIGANNRQEWLNEVHLSIANYLMNIAFIQPKVKGLIEEEELVKYVEKVLFYKSKTEILLNGPIDSQKDILKAMNEFSEIMTLSKNEYKDDLFEEKRKKLIETTRVFFYNYQRKVS